MSDNLDDLLADLANAAGADATRGAFGDRAGAVHRVVTRVRRRRAARRTGAGVAVACAAGALTFGAVQVRPGPGPAAHAPDPSAHARSDWPAQFDRCGKDVDDVLDATDDVSLEAKLTQGTGATLRVETTMTGPADVEAGWVYGTELTVVDSSGKVVGVQEGPSMPALADVAEHYAGAAYASEPFPLASSDELPLVSCDQYPTGSGDVGLGSGAYHLWVTQTVGYPGADGTAVARANADVPLVVEPSGTPQAAEPTPGPRSMPTPTNPTAGSPADELFRCGEPVDVTIHTLPDAGGLTLAADMPEEGWGEHVLLSEPAVWVPPQWSVTLGSSQGATLHAHGSPAGSIAFVDEAGVVVGFANPSRGPLRAVTVGPDTTEVLDGPTSIRACNDQLLEGTLTAWPFTVETLLDDEGQDPADGHKVVVVANPRAVSFGS